MHPGEQVRSHLQHKHRQAQRGRDPQIPSQGAFLGCLAQGDLLRQMGGGHGHTRIISRIFDGTDQGGRIGLSNHMCPLGCQIDRGIGYPGHGFQRTFHPGDARGASHALDLQIDRKRGDVIARILDSLDEQRTVNGCAGHLCPFGGKVDRRRLNAGHRFQSALDTADARGAGHALDVENEFLCLSNWQCSRLHVHSGTPSAYVSAIRDRASHDGKVKGCFLFFHSRVCALDLTTMGSPICCCMRRNPEGGTHAVPY